MSVMEIPDELYKSIYDHQVMILIDRGLDLKGARQMAREIMDNCFISRTTSIQCDTQKDYDEMRQGDWTR